MQHWQASFTWLSWLSWLVTISFRAHSHLYAWDSNNAKPSAWWLLDNASFTLKVESPINRRLMINNSNRTSVSNKKDILWNCDISWSFQVLAYVCTGYGPIIWWLNMIRFPPQSRIPKATSGCWQEVKGNYMTISIITWMIFDGFIIINPITNSISHAKHTGA